MDNETVTLIVGLAGIAATLISSVAGLYFVSKERSSSLRSALFEKQLELMTDINFKMARFRVFAIVLSQKDSQFFDQASKDLRTCFKEFSELEAKGAVLLPVELWVNLGETHCCMSNLITDFEEKQLVEGDRLTTLIAAFTKTALISRSLTGADELSQQAIGLFSSRTRFKRVNDIDASVFESLVEQRNG